MRYIFYADIYFIQNFMMKVAVVYLSLYFNKMQENISTTKEIAKICLVSFISIIFEITGLLLGNSYSLFLLFVNVFEIPLMFIGILGKKRESIIKLIILGYFFTMLINGVLEALWNQFGEHGCYMFCLLFSCGAVIVGVRIWKNYTKIQKGIFLVQMQYRGKTVQVNGFYDSGNRLVDPYTQKGVHIVSEQRLKELEVNNSVYIPYQSLGNETGMLEVYYIDEIIIEGEKGRKSISNCPVGVTKDNLFKGKKYEMILNEEVF